MRTSPARSPADPESSRSVKIPINDALPVSGLFQASPGAHVCYVLAHGAGAGMRHPFLADVANGLADRCIGTLRYQFPYMEKGSKRPDVPQDCTRHTRAAVVHASSILPEHALFAGGKSFGGRMTSQAQAEDALARSSRSDISRVSTSSAWAAIRRARRAFVQSPNPDVVFARGPRRIRRLAATSISYGTTWYTRHA